VFLLSKKQTILKSGWGSPVKRHQTFADFESSVQAFYSFMLRCSSIEALFGTYWSFPKKAASASI
jgi:hypothetical protein